MNVPADRAEPESALTRLRRALRIREALRYTPTVGGVVAPALRVGVSFGAPIAVLVAIGHPDLVPFAAFGAFTSLYCRVDTWSRRARLLPLIALGLVVSVATATMIAAATGNALIGVLVLTAIATVGKLVSDVLEFGPPGGLMFVFAAGAAAYAAHDWSGVGLHIGIMAASAALSVALSLLGNLLHPTGPHRVATARALVAIADHLESPNPATRHRAHHAAHRASATLRGNGRTVTALRAHLADAEHLLHHPAEATHLRDLARKLHRGRIPRPAAAPKLPRNSRHAGAPWSARISPFLPNAGRMLLSCLLAGLITLAVGLDHAYWAVVSASAVLQSTNATATWHRTVQRMTGTLGGAVLAFAMFGFQPSPLAILVLVVVCQLIAELFVQANYALGLLFVTPLALGLASLSNPAAHDDLIVERIATTVLGALVAAAVSLVLINRQSSRRLNAALTGCREAQQQLREADQSTVAESRARLMRAVFALRNAHAVADGEPRHRDPRTREVLDTEHEAYELLAATVPARTSSRA
ncbi:Fusaric acid resistance protein-like [Saccharopolyspora antimicrobica]|uniref:Fusaric acid resistance family protein n=1 Tax=Saccharopolyspora antimicrobica TaxID=455193 RepID=A0A1I4S9C0_9PSEU|nr:FUSC family protein [Saccharopolyspora antimicrobica]RKT87650.1 fusaric acid resistance family protein [Saccharopolyspora antimicrobica]SFM61107.1 Fusaric acid resistance protein-like [Saccharopolyspora antimicrobica]